MRPGLITERSLGLSNQPSLDFDCDKRHCIRTQSRQQLPPTRSASADHYPHLHHYRKRLSSGRQTNGHLGDPRVGAIMNRPGRDAPLHLPPTCTTRACYDTRPTTRSASFMPSRRASAVVAFWFMSDARAMSPRPWSKRPEPHPIEVACAGGEANTKTMATRSRHREASTSCYRCPRRPARPRCSISTGRDPRSLPLPAEQAR